MEQPELLRLTASQAFPSGLSVLAEPLASARALAPDFVLGHHLEGANHGGMVPGRAPMSRIPLSSHDLL